MTPYYDHAGIKIFHGDCREILPQIEVVDLVFTSPPYNLGMTAHFHDGGLWASPALAEGYGQHSDKMPWDEYESWQREILRLCWSRLSDTGAIYYNHKPRPFDGEVWLPTVVNPGLPLRQIVTWTRAAGMNFAPTHYVPTFEWILIFAKPDFRLRDRAASGLGDTWYSPADFGNPHPAPFPLTLPTRAIETTTAQLICDPFCGSGTTLRAAKDLGRRAIGIEIEEKYCEIAAKRLSQEVFQF